jgi:hypothetical protein
MGTTASRDAVTRVPAISTTTSPMLFGHSAETLASSLGSGGAKGGLNCVE